MLSAHGSAPEVERAASDGSRPLVNAVCPLVTKVHHELKVRAQKGYTVVYVGHAGHEEAIGRWPSRPRPSDSSRTESDVDALAEIDGDPVALWHKQPSRTTNGRDRRAGKDRFPELWMPTRSDLCYATTNRQAALGDRRTLRCGRRHRFGRTPRTPSRSPRRGRGWVRQGDPGERRRRVPDDLSGTSGVTAGASAPEGSSTTCSPARPGTRRGDRRGDRRGRVLPTSSRAP